MDAVKEDRVLRIGKWRVEPMLNRISCMDVVEKIEPQNMKLLLWLASHPGEVISLEQIESAVWRGLVVTSNSVYQSVAQLRRALGDSKANPIYIETVSRKGYRLIAPVSFEIAELPAEEIPQPQPADVRPEHASRRLAPRLTYAALIAMSVIACGVAIYSYAVREKDPAAKNGSMSGPSEKLAEALSAPSSGGEAARAELLIQLGDAAFNQLGNQERARVYFEQALALQAQVSDQRDPRIARILIKLAGVELWNSNYAAAEAKAREAVEIFEEAAPTLHPDMVRAHFLLASILVANEQYAEASIHSERSLQVARLLYGEAHIRTLDAENSLATLRLAQGRLDEAEAWARLSLKKYIEMNGAEEIDGTYHVTTLALVLYKKGSYAEAAAQAKSALDTLARIAPPDHGYVASAQHILGESLTKLGEFAAAERALRTELRMLKDTKAEQWRVARASSALGEALLEQDRIGEAEAQLTFAARELAGLKGWLETDARLATQERLQRLRRVKDERDFVMANSE